MFIGYGLVVSLSSNLYYCAKIVILYFLGVSWLELRGTSSSCLKGVISFLYAHRMVDKGCLSYLDYVYATNVCSKSP